MAELEMRPISIKALILLGLFALTSNVQSLFADVVRSRPAKQSSSIESRQKRARVAKKPTTRVRPKKSSKKVQAPRKGSEGGVRIRGNPEHIFLALDRNGDGFISPTEWPAERRSFDLLDRNSDGRISQGELRSH